VTNDDDFEELDAAAAAALQHALTLPPGLARSQALKEAGKLRSMADRLQAPTFAPRGRRPKYRVSRNEEHPPAGRDRAEGEGGNGNAER
jgi:hypothetical protein